MTSDEFNGVLENYDDNANNVRRRLTIELEQGIVDVKKIQIAQLKTIKCAFVGCCCMLAVMVTVVLMLIVYGFYSSGIKIDQNSNEVSKLFPIVCEDIGWVNGESVNLGCLLFLKRSKKYSVAKKYCTQNDAHLVEIFSPKQMDFLVNKLKSLDEGNRTYWWGGATDEQEEGAWQWSLAGTKVESFVWGVAQPDTSTARNFLCFGSAYNYFGNDCHDRCAHCPNYIICQKRITKESW